jgi:hypothetical protein
VVEFLLNWARHYFFHVSSSFFFQKNYLANFYHLLIKQKKGKKTSKVFIGKNGPKLPYSGKNRFEIAISRLEF